MKLIRNKLIVFQQLVNHFKPLKTMKKILQMILVSFFTICYQQMNAQLYSEHFNDPASLNTSYTLEDLAGTTYSFVYVGSDYFTNDDVANLLPGSTLIGHDGSKLIGIEDYDGAGLPAESMAIVTKAIDVTNYGNISISLRVASTSTSATRYETDDGLDVQYQLDNGNWITVGSFKGRGNESIPFLYEDADLNNSYETETAADFRTVSYSLDARAGSTVTGGSLKVRLLVHSEGSQEEIFLDDLIVTGTYSAPSVSVSLSVVKEVSCNGENEGSIKATVTPGVANYTYEWSNGSSTSNTSSTTNTITGLVAGTYTVTVTDKNGKTDQASITLTQPTMIVGETTSKPVSCTGSQDGEITLAVSGGVSPYTFKWSNAETTQNVSGLVAGDYSVVITDKNNCTIDVNETVLTVLDETKPSISAMKDVMLDASPNCVANLPDYTSKADVSDNCDGNPVVSQTPTSGSVITGEAMVTLTVKDVSGNENSTTFKVSLKDVIAPVVQDMPNDVLSSGINCTALLPDYSNSVVFQECDPNVKITQQPVVGSVIAGITVVTIKVVDMAGNEATTSFAVSLEDKTAPEFATKLPESASAYANNECKAMVPDYVSDLKANDNCDDNLKMYQTPVAGSEFMDMVKVMVYLEDKSGNVNFDSVKVYVYDTITPKLVCPKDTIIKSEKPVVFEYKVLVEENCGFLFNGVSQGLESGSEFPIGTTTVEYTATDETENGASCSFNVTVDPVTALQNLSIDELVFYPNPTSGWLNIPSNQTISVLEVRNTDGDLLKSVLSPSAQIDLSDLTNGTYLIHFIDETGSHHQLIELLK